MTTKKFLITVAVVSIAIVVAAVVAGIMFAPKEAQVKIEEGLKPLGYSIVDSTSNSLFAVLQAKVLPSEERLKVTALKIWEKEKEIWEKELTFVFLYLPGMDTGGAAYAVAEFDEDFEKFKINPSSLEGTKWVFS